jgi:Phage terminase, small subunit
MPLSRDPNARERQLANLRSGPSAPSGNAYARRHGGYAQIARERLDAKVIEVAEAIGEDLPLRDGDGGVPRADTVALRLLAECLVRVDDVSAHLRNFGMFDQETGEPRPALELERRLRQEALDQAESLGLTPRSRARLGLDLQRGVDLAQGKAMTREERRAFLAEHLPPEFATDEVPE